MWDKQECNGGILFLQMWAKHAGHNNDSNRIPYELNTYLNITINVISNRPNSLFLNFLSYFKILMHTLLKVF